MTVIKRIGTMSVRSDQDGIHAMTLGELIQALEDVQYPANASVQFDFGYVVPTRFDSYRGYYDQLALGYAISGRSYASNGPIPTSQINQVAELAALARMTVGQEFTGWKGGEYTMTKDTQIWVDNPGDCSGTRLVGVECTYGSCILLTTRERETETAIPEMQDDLFAAEVGRALRSSQHPRADALLIELEKRLRARIT